MNSDTGSVLAGFKGRMQALRDELDNLKDDYDAKCKECEALKEEKNQAASKEVTYESIRELNEKLKTNESALDECQAQCKSLSKENGRLEEDLQKAQEAYKLLNAELEATLKDLGAM